MSSAQTDKSNQVLKEIINNSWSGIGIIDKKSKFIYVNDAFQPILGYKAQELLQIDFESLILPEYKEEFKQLLEKNYKSEYTNNIQVGCLRKDNAIVYLDISIKMMSNKTHIVINVNDVTKNKSDHETFDKYVIQLHINTDGVINQVSEAFCRLTLYSSEELLGRSYDVLVYPELNDENLQELITNYIQNNQQWTGVITSKTKHGDLFWVDVIIKPIKNKYGDITGYSAVMFDITNELNLQKNTVILEETILNNEEKLKIMADTMRTVAHEWRQPLNVISLDAQNLLITYQLMDEVVPKEEAVPVLESMQKHIEDLSSVISKFQYITEFKADKIEVSLEDLITKAIEKSDVDKEIISYDISDNFSFDTYDEALSKIIASILNNAQDALDNKSDEKEKFIKCNMYEKNQNIYFEISNNGGNIPKEIINDIFTPYFSTKECKNGVGLSLYSAKMIVEFHLKGKIVVTNKANNIVVFTIILPRRG